MTPIVLLDRLKEFIEMSIKDVILPSRNSEPRAAKVYKGNLPNKEAETKQVPYILIRFITGKDDQLSGEMTDSECRVRIIVVTYSDDGEEGYINALNLITRIRIALLKERIIGDQFLLKMPLEYIVYEDDTDPYHIGEMMTIWNIPAIEREVCGIWQ